MSLAAATRYAAMLEHADDPVIARRCGYSTCAVPVQWQAWEILARFGEAVAHDVERGRP